VGAEPGLTTLMHGEAPSAQTSRDVALSAGWLLTMTVGLPGTQGDVVVGVHGAVAPAALADTAAGFDGELQMPNGMMFTNGLKSWMVATGAPPAVTGGPSGVTVSGVGATPNMHCSRAPIVTI